MALVYICNIFRRKNMPTLNTPEKTVNAFFCKKKKKKQQFCKYSITIFCQSVQIGYLRFQMVAL